LRAMNQLILRLPPSVLLTILRVNREFRATTRSPLKLFTAAGLLYAVYKIYRTIFPHPNLSSNGKLVLISGCDSGFGSMLARQLDQRGYQVLAGCFTEKGAKELAEQTSSNVETFRLDITNPESVTSAKELVQRRGGKLWALVNNAGRSDGQFIEWNHTNDYRRTFDVNVFGHIEMIKQLLPYVISTKGRIVNVTSVTGFLAGNGISAYASSKHAFEGYTDSLRREMFDRDVSVSIIEPGVVATHGIISDAISSWHNAWAKLPEETKTEYGGEKWFLPFIDHLLETYKKVGGKPQTVVDDMIHAITNSRPQSRYRPGAPAKILYVLNLLPAGVMDFIERVAAYGRPKPAFVAQ